MASQPEVHANRSTSHDSAILATPDAQNNFVRGWNKLPLELRIHILEFNLIYIAPYKATEDATTSILLPYLRMTKEIADLAREIYFKKNVICLEVRRQDGRRRALRYPPPLSNRFIRRLEVELAFIDFATSRFWPKIPDLASGRYGFPNLRFLHIQLILWGRGG
ncbi:uncharacterized protein N0V89_001369 [Didymosphaeria variabile]|uniref:Uncharacterized protein n=1 Tax=Didymosphaeria variabile TaxID=1932322 RepID=A0A9W8XW02_9PLEO|nr:uncharacterized protein N0V89_001369 [Didymosphaeria variabile]KAJ4360802.1 hypothetical protein N0V89_001369 [Didymosphaeria variabile]